METICEKKNAKLCLKFYCKSCDYGTSKKSSFDNHKLALKHQKSIIGDTLVTQNMLNYAFSTNFTCDKCNKKYLSRNGLWKHKKKCLEQQPKITSQLITSELILEIIKDNREMKQLMINQNNTINEIIKNGTHNTSNSHNNSNNKTFNLQFFLNETCKDAMNISEFVDSIKLQLTDLENVGKIGYVNGISDIITKNLKELDVTQRPVHCTDKKREVLYVKDENKWEKEDEEKKNIRRVIKRIADKNIKLIPQFKEKHPDCLKSHSKYTDQYNKIIIESMGGPGDNDEEKEDKIIKNISKIITIDKE
jgi:hypothetical protein